MSEAKVHHDKEDIDSKYDTINIDGVKYLTHLPKKYLNKKPYLPKDMKKVYAFIPGTILKVYVKVKDKVKKGDKLLVLSAMKMSNDLLAPMNGVISKIHIKDGDMVPKSQILIEFK